MSPSISGILSAVRSGLAVAPLALSVAGGDVQIFGAEEGFPVLSISDVCLYGNGAIKNPLVANLVNHVRESFYTRKRRCPVPVNPK